MMSDGTLSQDEINALLSGTSSSSVAVNTGFSSEDTHKFKSLFSSVADSVQSLIAKLNGSFFDIEIDDVVTIQNAELLSSLEGQVAEYVLPLGGSVSGYHSFLLSESVLSALFAQQDSDASQTFSDRVDLFSQVGKQAAEKLVNLLTMTLSKDVYMGDFDVHLHGASSSLKFTHDTHVVIIYNVGDKNFNGKIYEMIDVELAEALLGKGAMPPSLASQNSAALSSSSHTGGAMSYNHNTPNVQGVQLSTLTPSDTKPESQNITLLMDVNMELTVELGRTRWQIKDILGMGEGTIIELDKLAGEPVDILVNRNLIARGEVVVIDENFGVRVTEIISGIDKITDRRV
jgi:flagellar motor switch protein FliN/FliY